jgi:hypothetical protein
MDADGKGERVEGKNVLGYAERREEDREKREEERRDHERYNTGRLVRILHIRRLGSMPDRFRMHRRFCASASAPLSLSPINMLQMTCLPRSRPRSVFLPCAAFSLRHSFFRHTVPRSLCWEWPNGRWLGRLGEERGRWKSGLKCWQGHNVRIGPRVDGREDWARRGMLATKCTESGGG